MSYTVSLCTEIFCIIEDTDILPIFYIDKTKEIGYMYDSSYPIKNYKEMRLKIDLDTQDIKKLEKLKLLTGFLKVEINGEIF
jgi:hypothetical protein